MAEPKDPKRKPDPQPEPEPETGEPGDAASLEKQIQARVERRLRARQRSDRSVWFGLGMFGLVGWSVAIPTIAGIALGLYLDEHHPAEFSWTISLLAVGVVLGCLNAWYWVQQERSHD